MAHASTVLAQLLRLVPRHEFETLAREHHHGQKLRRASRWDQFVALTVGQVGGRLSLRDIEAALGSQRHKLYHLGSSGVRRSTLARMNERQPHRLYEALFGRLLAQCKRVAPRGHGFRFKSPLISLDSTLIDLSLAVFPWADFNREKAAMKLHVGLNHAGHYPEFVAIGDGKESDIERARRMVFPRGSMLVFDRGYLNYAWYKSLNDNGIFFVTRARPNMMHTVLRPREVPAESGVLADADVVLTSPRVTRKLGRLELRQIEYEDPETGHRYQFLTNRFDLSPVTIARIYKARWQIELFFKAIKQTLRIRSFLGTSRNAILTQVWIAMCVYLLIAYLRFAARLPWTMLRIVRVLAMNLFERRPLLPLLGDPDPPDPPPHAQLNLAGL